jgi:hypothetical protein
MMTIGDRVCLLIQPSMTGEIIGCTEDMFVVRFDNGTTDTVFPFFLKKL